MKVKSIVAFVLAGLFLLSILCNLRAYAQIMPQIYLTSTAVNNQAFSVEVFTEDILGTDPVYAYQVKLFFNATFLQCTGASIPQTDNSWIFSASPNTVSPTPVISNTAGYTLLGASILGANAPSVSGLGPFKLATIDFTTKAKLQDAATSYVNLDSPETYLLDKDIREVPVALNSEGSVNCVLPTSTKQMSIFNSIGRIDSSSKVSLVSTPLPSDPSVSPDPQVNCHWWAGGYYPSTSTTYNAKEVCMKIRTPNSSPSSSECYYLLLSVFDDNGSYDQIGFADDFSDNWSILYSTTTTNPNLLPQYALIYSTTSTGYLSPGTEYDFTITANNNGNITFAVWTETGEIWSMTNQTGGNKLLIENWYTDKWDSSVGGNSYTVYEEVWNQKLSTGPAFNFLFYYTYFTLYSGGTPTEADYTAFQPYNQPNYPQPPSNVVVTAGTNSILVENTNVPYQAGNSPVFDMKTQANGQFYVPFSQCFMNIDEVFTHANLVGDQVGGASPYKSITWTWPCGSVDMSDVAFVASCFGMMVGQDGWWYMADIVPPWGVVDISDVAAVSANYGASGSYNTNPLGCTITFDVGGSFTPVIPSFVQIPSGATTFNITQNGSPVGACVTFWTP